MRTRVIVGISLALAIFALLALDAWLWDCSPPTIRLPRTSIDIGRWLTNGLISALLVFILTVLCTHELIALARARGYRPFGWTAQVFAAALVLGPYVSFNLAPITGRYDESWGLLWMALALALMFLFQAIVHRTTNAMENLATTIFIVFYAGGLAGFMTKLRMEIEGSAGITLLVFSVFIIKMTDTGAYFVGSLLGRHKMVPWLSPKKTWEGFVGGLATAVLVAVVVGHWLRAGGLIELECVTIPFALTMALCGLVLALFSVAGDLCASLLKRDAHVGDSGRAFPGLGGVLDVMDSPLLAAPVAWVIWARVLHAG